MKNLHESWKTPEIQETLEYVRKSHAANSDLAPCTSEPVYGWVGIERRSKETRPRAHKNKADEVGHTLSDAEIAQIIVEFQKKHPNLKLETQDENRTITTSIRSMAQKLNFQINIERDDNGQHTIKAECLGIREPFPSITRCLSSRAQQKDLNYLLVCSSRRIEFLLQDAYYLQDMIAAYKTVNGTSCAKCGSIVDKHMMVPSARRTTPSTNTEETPEMIWQALHESCLE